MRSEASGDGPRGADRPASSTPLLGLGIALVLLVFWPGLEQPGKAPREAVLLVLGPLLVLSSTRFAPAAPRPAFRILLGLALAWATLAAAVVPRAELYAAGRELGVLLALGLTCLAAAWHPQSAGEAGIDRSIERGVVCALLPIGLVGLAQAWWGFSVVEQAQPPAALFVNRNVAAHALVVLVPVALAAVPAARGGWTRWPAGCAAGLGLALLIATRSRGAWLAALFGWGLGLAWWLARRRVEARGRGGGLAGPAAIVLGLGLLALLVPSRGQGRPLPSVPSAIGTLARATEGSGAIRLALWRNTLAMLEDRPWLGVGPGRFSVEFPAYHSRRIETPGFGLERQPESPENDALEFAAELGLPAALLLLTLLLGAVLLTARGDARRTALDNARAAGRLAALAGALLQGLVSFPLHSPATAFLVWLLVGRAWASDASPARPRAVGYRRFLAGAAGAASLFAVWVGLCEVRAQAALAGALRAKAGGDCATALDRAREVSRLASWRRRDVGIAAMVQFDCDPDPERTLLALEPALAIHPHQLNLLMAVGARRLKADRPAEAARAFLHATELLPGLGRAWLGLAMARRASGEEAGAAAACREALLHAPGFEPARVFCGVGPDLRRESSSEAGPPSERF